MAHIWKKKTVHVLHIGGGILLNQQLWLMKKEENMPVGGGIWDCNSYVPTSLFVSYLVLTLAKIKLHKYRLSGTSSLKVVWINCITWDDNPWISKGHTSWLLVDLAKDCADNVEIVCALLVGFYWSWYQAYYKYKLREKKIRSSSRNKRRDFLVLSFCKCCVRERIERIFLYYYSLVQRAYWVYLGFGFVRVFSCHLCNLPIL